MFFFLTFRKPSKLCHTPYYVYMFAFHSDAYIADVNCLYKHVTIFTSTAIAINDLNLLDHRVIASFGLIGTFKGHLV